MTVRPATADDIEAVAALDRILFGPDGWSDAQVAEELTGEHRRAWVVGRPLVGYAVTRTAGDVTDLHRIGVRPDQRRRGVARALLTAALAAADRDRMLLEVSVDNVGAVAFYTAEGFAEIDRRPRYYRDGTNAVVMERLSR